MNRLWTKNFTILTLGSFASALGNAAAGIAFGILIFQQTGSPFTLAIYTVLNIIPRVLVGFLAGPFVDRHSRRKMIYTLDFMSTIFFGVVAMILFTGYFNVILFTGISMLFGIMDTIYQLAFMSLFPEVIEKGEHMRAYSLSSLIWPISAAIMAPIAAFMIENFTFGVAVLMAFNSITFLIAASLETKIKVNEVLNTKSTGGLKFIEDSKEGFHYYKAEKGILGIGVLFAAFSFVYSTQDLLRMPYFISSSTFTLQDFSFLITASSVGRIIGGLIHYAFRYPPHIRYQIAVTVYIIVEIFGATMLYMPYVFMIVISFTVGLLSVTSYNIRMSSTQIYIPNHMRGRVNASQNLLWNLGAILGALIMGAIAEYSSLDYRLIMLFAAIVSLTAIIFIPIRMKDEFKKVYNADI